MIKKLLLGMFIVAFASLMAWADCNQEKPRPAYDPQTRIGWNHDIPKPNPEYPNCIIKEFVYRDTRIVFVDNGKTGACDYSVWFVVVAQDEDGQDLYDVDQITECGYAEDRIKGWIRNLSASLTLTR